MAPEVLKREKYKTAADIFSFAVTMYEVFGWCTCYPKNQFQYAWDIVNFVVERKRRPIAAVPGKFKKNAILFCYF